MCSTGPWIGVEMYVVTEARPWFLVAGDQLFLNTAGAERDGLLWFSLRIPDTLEGGTREENVPLAPAAMPELLERETCEKWKRPFR